jgi:hypothetical protein
VRLINPATSTSGFLAWEFAIWFPTALKGSTHPPDFPAVMSKLADFLPEDHDAGVDLFEQSVRAFREECDSFDLDAPTWAFGDIEDARFWARRAAGELTVHLTDAAGIHGRESSTPAHRRSEAIGEALVAVWANAHFAREFAQKPAPIVPAQPAGLEATDTGRQWTLSRGNDDSIIVADGLSSSCAAVARASSRDLLAWLWGRPMNTQLSVDGDPALIKAWDVLELTSGV